MLLPLWSLQHIAHGDSPITVPDLVPLLPLIFLGALLYTSVGHGGATVYLAIFTMFQVATGPLVTTVLVMNIVAASIAWFMFRQAGHLRWQLLIPFVVTSVPMAYVGGLLPLSGRMQTVILGVALLMGAARLLVFGRVPSIPLPRSGGAFYLIAIGLGALLGFLAGSTGIGGGIFLSPVLIACGWANVRQAGSVASAFIVLNSLAGLAAKLPATPIDPLVLGPLVLVVVFGALTGSYFGASRLPLRAVQVSLGVVLFVASLKNLLA